MLGLGLGLGRLGLQIFWARARALGAGPGLRHSQESALRALEECAEQRRIHSTPRQDLGWPRCQQKCLDTMVYATNNRPTAEPYW
jgi:hypothetical protein